MSSLNIIVFAIRDKVFKAMPQPAKRILRKVANLLHRTKLIELIVPRSKVLGSLQTISATRATVLVVSHEASRTGAPILSYNLVNHLLQRYNVVILFLSPGPLRIACQSIGAIVVGPVMFHQTKLFSGLAIKQILKAVQIKFALVNSIESRHVLPTLAKFNIPTVSLVHEFAAYTRPRRAFYDAIFWSGQTVFSTKVTRDNMVAEYPDLDTREYPVIPQGRCALPEERTNQEDIAGELGRIQRTMRPGKFPADGIVVLAAGYVQYRKGVDLFIECAASTLRKAPNLPFRFIWVGKAYNPEIDVSYSVYLADQVRRAGLEKHVHFLEETHALEAVYAMADLVILSSRLDPLPNVAIDALAQGLPVICFDKATGIADILHEHGLGRECVATYLNTEDMASKVLALAQSKELRESVAERSKKISAEVFNMNKYVNEIEQLALKEVDRVKQAILDVEIITKSDLLRMSEYFPHHLLHIGRDETIDWYVRTWASAVDRFKLFPGFHPGIYQELHGVEIEGNDPLADYLRAGKPSGPWNFELITPATTVKPIPKSFRIGLHIHAYYPDLFSEILDRVLKNSIRPDLLISVTSESDRCKVSAYCDNYTDGIVDIRIVPNRGRDIGPFITEFGETILQNYDVIGHLHTKKTEHQEDEGTGRDWYQFLLENLVGGRYLMADIILSKMAQDEMVNMVFPDDPNIVGWAANLNLGKKLLSDMGIEHVPREVCFPIGSMFWARTAGLKALFDLSLSWEDFPDEPLHTDGTLPHALERTFGIVATQRGGAILQTYVQGITR